MIILNGDHTNPVIVKAHVVATGMCFLVQSVACLVNLINTTMHER